MARNETEEAFAARLGVARGGLQSFLRKHSMPSLRTAVFAYREFGIVIPYAGISTQSILSKTRKGTRAPSEMQMTLPLTIETADGEINVVLKRKTTRRYRFQVRLRKTG